MIGLIGWLLKALLLLVGLSILWTGLYRVVDPPFTYIMARDRFAGVAVKREWRDLSTISRHLTRAVIGAEDARFCQHRGFDLDAIEAAIARNKAGKTLRGGSTISQQTAKNAFLWPGRTMVRKGIEAWFTVLIEALWGKPRIMEVYLNIAEFGRGIYGVEAASRHYFQKSAKVLTRQEAARLAAILPQPLKRDAAAPGRLTQRYANRIAKRARVVANEGIDACVWR